LNIPPNDHLRARARPAGLRRWRSVRGMTMAEVLIAAVLLAFVIMTSLTALSQAYGITRHARMVTLAGQIVQSAMEDLRLRNYNDLKAYAAQSQPVSMSALLASERFASNFTQGFSLTAQYTTLVTSTSTQYGKIGVTITVSWTENNVSYTRKIITRFGEKGLSDYYYVGWGA
jgi:Tfp pilus assembly protein PilV